MISRLTSALLLMAIFLTGSMATKANQSSESLVIPDSLVYANCDPDKFGSAQQIELIYGDIASMGMWSYKYTHGPSVEVEDTPPGYDCLDSRIRISYSFARGEQYAFWLYPSSYLGDWRRMASYLESLPDIADLDRRMENMPEVIAPEYESFGSNEHRGELTDYLFDLGNIQAVHHFSFEHPTTGINYIAFDVVLYGENRSVSWWIVEGEHYSATFEELVEDILISSK